MHTQVNAQVTFGAMDEDDISSMMEAMTLGVGSLATNEDSDNRVGDDEVTGRIDTATVFTLDNSHNYSLLINGGKLPPS